MNSLSAREIFPAVTELVPQSGRSVLIDAVIAANSDSLTCSAVASAARAFGEDAAAAFAGRPPTWIALEYMAQTVAAFVGLRKLTLAKPVRVGYLLGSRRLEMLRPFLSEGQLLHVSAARIWDNGVLGVFECAVTDAATGEVVARGQIKVHEPSEPTQPRATRS